jgi:hypothetical protein
MCRTIDRVENKPQILRSEEAAYEIFIEKYKGRNHFR